MKKLIALMLVLMILSTAALAEVYTATKYGVTVSLDIGSWENYEPTPEDEEEDIVLWFGDEENSVMGLVFVLEPDDYTNDKLADMMLEDMGSDVIRMENVTINGRPYVRAAVAAEGAQVLSYMTAVDGSAVMIMCFAYDDVSARIDQMMRTVTINSGAGAVTVPNAFASSNVTTISGTGLSLDLTGMQLLALDDTDKADDVVLHFINSDMTMECVVWCEIADDLTLADLAEEVAEDESVTSSGYTTINGYNAFFDVAQDEEGLLVDYYLIEQGKFIQISFMCLNEEAANQSGQIMNTLR